MLDVRRYLPYLYLCNTVIDICLSVCRCCCSSLCRRDLGYFEMECPEFTTAAELREDLAKYESMWGVFEEFNTGLQELRKEDWISFRYIHCSAVARFTY